MYTGKAKKKKNHCWKIWCLAEGEGYKIYIYIALDIC